MTKTPEQEFIEYIREDSKRIKKILEIMVNALEKHVAHLESKKGREKS